MGISQLSVVLSLSLTSLTQSLSRISVFLQSPSPLSISLTVIRSTLCFPLFSAFSNSWVRVLSEIFMGVWAVCFRWTIPWKLGEDPYILVEYLCILVEQSVCIKEDGESVFFLWVEVWCRLLPCVRRRKMEDPLFVVMSRDMGLLCLFFCVVRMVIYLMEKKNPPPGQSVCLCGPPPPKWSSLVDGGSPSLF